MQDLTIDTLASKRIPAASQMSSFPRLVAEYATRATRSGEDHNAVMTNDPPAKAATPTGAASRVASSAQVEQTRIYTGLMTMSGTFSDSLGQKGVWSGTLKDTLTVTVDAAGNGTGSEECDGILFAHVTEPDGSVKTTQSQFDFPIADLSLQLGKLTESNPQPFNYEGLILSVNVSGSLSKTQPTASENLSIPFDGTYEGVTFNGSINGTSTLKTAPLTIGGATARQTTYAASKMKPFGSVVVTDLNNVAVTATVTLSKPANGTLTNLAGGKYNRTTGVFTITGGEAVVNRALKGLTFESDGNLGSPGHRAPTGFTLRVTDGMGASRTEQTSVTTIDPLSIKGISAHRSTTGAAAIAPFRNVTVGDLLGGKADIVKVTLSNPKNGTLENLSGGVYSKTTGVYLLHANATTATSALRGLKFDPAASAGSAVTTSFTITVRNAAGAFVTDGSTTITANSATPGTTARTAVALFSQYVAAGLHGIPDHAAGISAFHDLPPSSHFEIAAGHR